MTAPPTPLAPPSDPPSSDPLPPVSSSPLARRYLVALVCILTIGAGLRFYRIGVPSLWFDEIVSIELSMGNRTAHDFFPDGVIRYDQPDTTSLASAAPWWKIWTHLQITTHPPIYFILLRWWMDIVGTGPIATRSLSVITSLAGISVFFDLCRLLRGPRVALLAAALMTLAISQIDIAQEARSYPLLILLGLACCDLLVRIQQHSATPARIVAFSALLTITILTHYFAAPALCALAIYAMLRLRGRDRTQTLFAFLAAVILFAAVWSNEIYWQLRAVPPLHPSYLPEVLPGHAKQTLLRIIVLPLQFLCGDDLSRKLPPAAHFLAAFLVFVLPIIRIRQSPDRLLWILWTWAVIGSVALLDLKNDSILLHETRYTILAAPAIFAILAGFHWPSQIKLPLIAATAAAVVVVCVAIRLHTGVPAKQDFQELSNIINTRTEPDELLVFYNNNGWLAPGVWYMGYKYYSPDSSHPWLCLRAAPNAKLMRELNQRSSIWMMGRQPEIDGPLLLPGWHLKTFWLTTAGRIALLTNFP